MCISWKSIKQFNWSKYSLTCVSNSYADEVSNLLVVDNFVFRFILFLLVFANVVKIFVLFFASHITLCVWKTLELSRDECCITSITYDIMEVTRGYSVHHAMPCQQRQSRFESIKMVIICRFCCPKDFFLLFLFWCRPLTRIIWTSGV